MGNFASRPELVLGFLHTKQNWYTKLQYNMKDTSIGLSTFRIEAFSDAVMAVAITLLVLEIKVPHVPEGADLWAALIPLWPKFLAFAVSFGVIGIFWVGHHIMFHYIKRTDRVLLWINTMLLMLISAIPFAAAFVGEHLNDPVAVALYGAILFLCGLMYLIIWKYAAGKRRLISQTLPEDMIRLGTISVVIAPILYGAAVILAFIDPMISKIIYLLLPLVYIIPSPIDRLVHFKDAHE